MWFKTRVGFASVDGPCQILVTKAGKTNVWFVFATLAVGQHRNKFPILKFLRATNPSAILARFLDGPDVNKEIAQCMEHIESVLLTGVDFCDLSQFGDPKAWEGKKLIDWNSEE